METRSAEYSLPLAIPPLPFPPLTIKMNPMSSYIPGWSRNTEATVVGSTSSRFLGAITCDNIFGAWDRDVTVKTVGALSVIPETSG